MCVVTGARIELAIGIISRIRKLFEPHGIFFDSKQTTVNINGVNITADADCIHIVARIQKFL